MGGERSGASSVLDEMRTSLVDVPAGRLRHGGPDGATVHTAHWAASHEAPADAPVQICLHGLGGSHLDWSLLGPLLTDLGPVCAPDFAGFGLTPLDGRPHRLHHRGEAPRPGGRARAGRCSRPAQRRQARSQGGAALRAVRRPQGRGGYLDARARRLTPPRTSGRRWSCAWSTSTRWTRSSCGRTSTSRRAAARCPTRTFITVARSLLRRIGPRRWHLWSQVDAISAPALILQGGQDPLVERIAADRLSKRRPDWDYRVYEEHGHVVMVEVPERASAEIHNWRAEHLPVTGPAI